MRKLPLYYGAEILEVSLPKDTRIIQPKPSLPRLTDVVAATREALLHPLSGPSLVQLVRPGSKVCIAFDDPAVFTFCDPDPRDDMLTAALEILVEAQVRLEDIHLLCANALHRKWTHTELGTLLGQARVLLWPMQRLTCHDAEDQEALVYLGETKRGFEVEVSKKMFESDLTIYLSVPLTPMNGGWKSTTVGLSSFRSIRHHHRPFPGASHSVMDPHNGAFHKLLREMGQVLQAKLDAENKHLMQVEAILDNNGPWSGQTQGVIGVYAGRPDEAHAAALAKLEEQLIIEVEGQSDILVLGLPNTDPYSQFSVLNPILATNLGLSYTYGLHQNKPLVRQGGILILHHPFENKFDDLHHPSYREFFERVLSRTKDPFQTWDLFADEFAHRPEFIHKYRYGYGFHGAHPFFMWNQTGAPRRHLSDIFIAGAKDFSVAHQLGFVPFVDLGSALVEARRRLGAMASLSVHPVPPISVVRVT
jgi:lactate racemase